MLTKKDLELIDKIFQKRLDGNVEEIEKRLDGNVEEIEKRLDGNVEEIEKRLDGNVKEIVKTAFQDFYDNIFEPYANKNEKEHEQMVKEIKAIKKDTEEIKEHVKDHDKRLRQVEDLTSIKN